MENPNVPTYLVAFSLNGCSKREAEKWGELIVDACRLDPKVNMEMHAVKDVKQLSQSAAQDIFIEN